jgi:hypothetical protein
MPNCTYDNPGARPAVCYRRADYTLRLVLYGLRVFFAGFLFYPLAGTGYVPVTTRRPPVWWASEARCGFLLLDSARQAGSGFAE